MCIDPQLENEPGDGGASGQFLGTSLVRLAFGVEPVGKVDGAELLPAGGKDRGLLRAADGFVTGPPCRPTGEKFGRVGRRIAGNLAFGRVAIRLRKRRVF